VPIQTFQTDNIGSVFVNIGTDIPPPTNATSSIVYSVSASISSFGNSSISVDGQSIMGFIANDGSGQIINGFLYASQFGETVSIPVAITMVMFGNPSLMIGS
jgi:hypothetical protein